MIEMTEEEAEKFCQAAIAKREKRIAIQQTRGDLLKAVQNDKMAEFKSLLEQGANPNEQDGFGNTALHFVAGLETTAYTRLLLDKGANPNILGGEDITIAPLSMAVVCNSPANVRLLLGRGADPDIENGWGDPPLINAASHDYTEIARLLIAGHADIDHRNKNGNTALIVAAFNGHAETVRLLIDKGADIEAKNDSGRTASDMAKDHPEIVQLLKEALETRRRRAEEKIRAAERVQAKRVRTQHNIAARHQRSLLASAPKITITKREPRP